MAAPRVRPIGDGDRPALARLERELWGADIVVGHGVVFTPADLPGLLAERDGETVGLLTYEIDGDTLEVVTIDAFPPGAGTGTALLDAAVDVARSAGCRRVWLMTTNDNLDALRFYQRRGFRLAGLRPGALAASRALKPEIPETGAYGIPLRDELDLEREV
jgi:ribosomal protein S18 acetylase RimI-like enzyme